MAALARILLVDDDPVSLRMLHKALDGGPYEIRTAADGVQGLEAARSFRPHLILSDRQMPHMDGQEFCRRVKSDSALSNTLFVMVSVLNDAQVAAQDRESGADECLVKPVHPGQLRARVENLLQKKRAGPAERPEAAQAPPPGPVDQISQLFVQLADLSCPGAATRAVQMAAAAEWMAEDLRLAPDQRPHLQLAASLQEIGRIGLPARLAAADPLDLSTEDWESWRVYAAISQVVLGRLDGFHKAAALVRHQFENWDGSGFPDHMQQARIPLGARILRVLVEFFHDHRQLEHRADRHDRLKRMQPRSGTLYDPGVYLALSQYVHQHLDASLAQSRRYLPLDDLEPGMKLGDDLVAASGAVLLREDEVLDEDALERIRRHHAVDPLAFSICVYPPEAEPE